MKYVAQLNLRDLWTRTLQEIDFLHDEAQRNDAGMCAPDLNTLSNTLSALRKDGPLSDLATSEIGQIEVLLHAAVARETLGTRNIFDGTNDPELGAIGRVLTVPILSTKGAALDALQQRFRTFQAMRNLLAARVDAEQQMARLNAAEKPTDPEERAA
ncbi:hypothetical protein [Pararhodobacter oceanensis]|uniref:hypothetical protein n=1 Tax=Pararhodobacter oceanensis TaxID=2172121 RepID=UPI003A958EE9